MMNDSPKVVPGVLLTYLPSVATRFELPSLLSGAPIRMVEVGTAMGTYARHLLEDYPYLTLTTVDPWLPYNDGHAPMGDRGRDVMTYRRNVAPHAARCSHLRMTSVEAANKLQNASCLFDLIYLDAAHDAANVEQDLRAWWPLVKVGGVLAGHDFDLPGVAMPVILFARTQRLNLHLICEHGGPDAADDGRGGKRPGTGKDQDGGWCHPSFFMFKP